MTTTRSGRSSGSPKSSPNYKNQNQSPPKSAKKRAAEKYASPPAKRGRRGKKEQQTIEESMEGIEKDEDIEKQINDSEKVKNETNDKDTKDMNGINGKNLKGYKNNKKKAFDEVKSDDKGVKRGDQKEQNENADKTNDYNESIIEDSGREAAISSSILEKGIIYFFFRPRVNIQDPKNTNDIARSHIVLRPIPLGTKLGSGPVEDLGNARLIAVPKKTLPSSGKDRFLSFVENTGATIKELREIFQGAKYSTKTRGTSNQPSERPFAEGVYALTTTGRDSHLAYIITVPSSIGSIQKSLGLAQRGSFVISVKNPTTPGPANANLSDPAKYPDDIMEKFRGRRWMPVEPEVLEYQHAQILLIGEASGKLGGAVEGKQEEGVEEEEKPKEEMERLEEEDEERVKGLDESDPVFADLGLSVKEFEKIKSTW